MKAVLLEEHGGLDQLSVGEADSPSPGPGQVRVRLRTAALNRLDIWVREGWPGISLEYPHIPGADGAGEVDALGPGVDQFSEGERVVINSNLSCGQCRFCLAGQDNMCRHWELLGETVSGTFAQYVVVPASNLLSLPQNAGYREAAAASLVFHTAWHSLITKGNLKAGESVLIVGASGGVNTASLQIANLAGATTYVVGSSEKKLALAESLGADHLINRSEVRWAKTVYEATGRLGVDVVVDNVGKGTMQDSMRSARKGGRILTVGNTGGPKYEIDHRYLFAKHLSILGSTMGTKRDFAEVMSLIFDGRLDPVVDRAFPMEEVRQAQARLEAGEQLGKIVLDIP
ncbi:MAG: zinc-binding dehydrogenase [Anaerolineales bacterium]